MTTLLVDCTIAGKRMSGIERYVSEVGRLLAAERSAQGLRTIVLLQRGMADAWSATGALPGVELRESSFGKQLATQQIWVPATVLRLRPDIAFFPGFPPSPLVFLARGSRIVRTIFDAVMWSSPSTISLKNTLYYKPLESFGSRRYARVHTISHHAKSDIAQHLPWLDGKITVSGCGVSDLAAPDAAGAAAFGVTGPYLLFVGTLEPRKNIPFLLDVFDRVRKAHPGLKLVVAGRFGWGADAVTERRAALGLEQDVVLTDAISDAQLSALYRGALALVYPSLHEGFGLPVVEAMSCGIPVISSNTTSLPEVGGDAAILIPPDDADAWVAAIDEVVTSPAVCERMIAAGRLHAKRFEWNAVAHAVAEAL